jgi:hypothetical protein
MPKIMATATTKTYFPFKKSSGISYAGALFLKITLRIQAQIPQLPNGNIFRLRYNPFPF